MMPFGGSSGLPPRRDPTAEVMDQFSQPNSEMPVIDDEAAMLVDTEGTAVNFHAKDVPESWRDADPYAMDDGMPAGSGYDAAEILGVGMPMMPESQPGPTDVKALRDAMLGRMEADAGKSDQFQTGAVSENEQLMRRQQRQMQK